MKISQALVRSPQNATSIRLVNAGVTEIDALPAEYCAARTLLLSQNRLRSLYGIEQFYYLERFSASQNLIDGFDEILVLQRLFRLRQLRLDGNPVFYHPAYRCRVLATLPDLTELDGIEVSANERMNAAATLAQIEYKEALIIADLTQLMVIRSVYQDPVRVLYERVQAYRIRRDRQATWYTIYDAVALQTQNELAGLRLHAGMSTSSGVVLYSSQRAFDASQTLYTPYKQQIGQLASPTFEKRTASVRNIAMRYAGADGLRASVVHDSPRTPQSKPASANLRRPEQNYGMNQALNMSETAPSGHTEDIYRMKQQMDAMRAQLAEYYRANEENVYTSVQAIHELQARNEQLKEALDAAYRTSTVYYQSAAEKQAQIAQLTYKSESTTTALVTLQQRYSALEYDCRQLAREVVAHQRYEHAVAALRKIQLRSYFSEFRINCRKYHAENVALIHLTQKKERTTAKAALAVMRRAYLLSLRERAFYGTYNRKTAFMIFYAWKFENRRVGFKESRLAVYDDAKGQRLHYKLYVERVFDCLLGYHKLIRFRAYILQQKERGFIETASRNSKNAVFEHWRQYARRYAVVCSYICLKQYKYSKKQAFSAIYCRLQYAAVYKRECDVFAIYYRLRIIYRVFGAFRRVHDATRMQQALQRRRDLACQRRVFCALRAEWRQNAAYDLAFCGAEFAARCLAAREAFYMQRRAFVVLRERIQRSRFVCGELMLSAERRAFSALRGAHALTLRDKLDAYSAKTRTEPDAALQTTCRLLQDEGERARQYLLVYKQEVQKFYAAARLAQSEYGALKAQLAAAHLDYQRLERVVDKLSAQLETARAAAREQTNESTFMLENEQLKMQNLQLKSATTDMGEELALLRYTVAQAQQNSAFDAVLARLKRAEGELQELRTANYELYLQLMQRQAEADTAKGGLIDRSATEQHEIERLRRGFEQAKSFGREMQEKLQIADAERRNLLYYLAVGADVSFQPHYVAEYDTDNLADYLIRYFV